MLNLSEHILLTLCWVAFCVSHSLFASGWWKKAMKNLLGEAYRFYRFLYSIFSAVSLAAVVYFLIEIESRFVWQFSQYILIFAVILGVSGVVIMLYCMRKYFATVTGIKQFSNVNGHDNTLQTQGLHARVRHPLYLGTLLFIWSLFFFWPYLSNLLSCLLVTIYTVAGIRMEERKLVQEFGQQYKEYALRVPMLIPRIFGRRAKSRPSLPETA